MNNNLPQKYNGNIFSKFFKLIKKVFIIRNNKKEQTNIVNQIEENDNTNFIKEDNIKNEFIDRLKIDENYKNHEEEKRKLMEELKEKPELLERFSVGILEKILKYYQDENERKKQILKKLIT